MVLLLAGGGAAGAAFYFVGAASPPFNGPIWTVKREPLQLFITERGALESAENSDLICRVKQGRKNTSTTIKWVIDNGVEVQKGQKLIELDDSALQEELKEQIIDVNKAYNDWVGAKEKCLITESQNNSDIEKAKTDLDLAKIELRKFLGDDIAQSVLPIKERVVLSKFLVSDLDRALKKQETANPDKSVSEIFQTVSDIAGRIENERSNKEQWLDRASWSQRMANNGLVSRSQAESDKARLDSANIALKKVMGELDIFKKFTIEQKVTELWAKVKEAERALDRTETQARSKLNADTSDRDSKEDIYKQEYGRKLEIDDEIAKCQLYAPQSGLVVYYLSEASRWGSGSQNSTINIGEPVKEGQKLMQIPNLSRMQVNAKVHEAMVSRVKGEVLRPTGYSTALQAGFSAGRPVLDVISNLAVHHSVRHEFLDKDFEVLYPGQPVKIRVDAYPSKEFQGRVKSVATVNSQESFFSSDVKLYQTIVSIDETVMNLKPGMSAQVTILAEESTEPVLTIPIQSVAGSIAMGAKRKCFVLENGQPKERDIVVGRSNDNLVEVTQGLHEGETVVLNPRSLLDEKSGMKTGTPATRRGGGGDEAGGDGGGKKSGGKKKGGGMPPGGMPPGGPGGPGLNPGGDPPGGGPPGAGKKFNRPEGAPVDKKS